MIKDKYHQEIRPETEYHYHIRELIEAQEKRSNDRTFHRDKEKARAERNDLIKEAKLVVLTDFWCESCKKDFKAIGIRQSEVDWTNTAQNIAFYKTKCWCGKWCIRFITDKERDPFWVKSRGVQADRARFKLDLLQPHETGFNLLYGKKN